MEGLFDTVFTVVGDHLILCILFIFICGHVNFVTISLMMEGKIIPAYKRPCPKNWQMLKESVKTDFSNMKLIACAAFPWWRELFIAVVMFVLFTVAFTFVVNLAKVLVHAPSPFLATVIVIKLLF